MISILSLDINEVLRMCKLFANKRCLEMGLPNVIVNISNGDIYDNRSRKAWANYGNFRVTISHDVSIRLLSKNPRERVRILNSMMEHELVHHRQFVNCLPYDEDEANREGRDFANKALAKYSPEQINPRVDNSRVKTNNRYINDYKSFHGMKNVKTRMIDYEAPKGPLVNIGEITSIEYRPNFDSKVKGSTFYHAMGDTGKKLFKSNCILATDGKNFFILRKQKNVKRPFFNEKGIIG